MNEQLAIYLWSIVDTVKLVLWSIPVAILMMYFLIAPPVLDFDWEGKLIPAIKKLTRITIICICIAILIPCQKDLALILLYPKIKHGAEIVVTSSTAKKMVDVVNLYLDKQIKELNNGK